MPKKEPLIERTSASYAMEWSIDLEKGLRSKKPGKALEAILQIMQRLERWDREPPLNKAQSDIFVLIPGEDTLFANSILLRLVDAFGSGHIQIKIFVVKVFLSLRRNRRRKRRKNDGILFKCNLENRLELLGRVKLVFDSGDVESRALALVLFGCLVDVAKDNADIRYLILSSLVSDDMLQVEASLFAGGCFGELSNDFASVLLEILVNLVTLSEASTTVRAVVARTFASMESSNAWKAYKAGLKLVLDSSEEEFLTVMLMSLSKLAAKSSQLIPEQVNLLSSFLTKEKSLGLRSVALKCLHYIAARGMYHFSAYPFSIQTLVCILDESNCPPALLCGALQILRKVFLYNLTTDACGNMLELPKLLNILQDAAQSSIMVYRHISIHFLVDILVGSEKALIGVDFATLVSETVLYIFNEVGMVVELVPDLQKFDLEMEQSIKTLLSLLLILCKRCPDLGPMVLERICLLIDNVVRNHDIAVETGEGDLTVGHEIVGLTVQDNKSIKMIFFVCVSRIVGSILENLDEAGTISAEVLDRVELMVAQVHKRGSFDCFTHVAFSFFLHAQITKCRVSNERENNHNLDGHSLTATQDCLVKSQKFSLDCAKEMLARKDGWLAYKLGRYAACQGAWSTAALMFEHLEGITKSYIYNLWLKSLTKFANSERNLELLKLQGGSDTLSWLGTDIGILVEACKSLRSSEETIAAIAKLGFGVVFSRWFLDLRAMLLEYVAEALMVCSLPLSEGITENSGQGENRNFAQLTRALAQISSQFGRLAREYDMMTLSFMGLDNKSLEIISENALSCSLLAFSMGFSVFYLLQQNNNVTEIADDCLQGVLIQDLAWRLQHRDNEISANFGFLFRVCKRPKRSLLHSVNPIHSMSLKAIGLLAVCKYAVSQVVILQREANGAQSGQRNRVNVSIKGLQLLRDIIAKWVLIPFRAPHHFFRVRPCISSELIGFNCDTSVGSKGISVLRGSQLTLDLCLQLKNVPASVQMQSMKVYCILYCKTSFEVLHATGAKTRPPIISGHQDWGGNDMVYANDLLFAYVNGSPQDATDLEVIKTFVRFELNEKGQGFSSCLLNVSSLTKGSYRTKWLSCCVDGQGSYWSLIPLNTGPVFSVV